MPNPSVQSVSGPTRYTSYPISHAHTCGGTNRVLYVAVTHDTNGVVSGVTYNGDTMDLVTSAIDGTNGYGTRVYRLINPDAGSSYNVVVSWTTTPGNQAFVTAVCVQDAPQTTPDRTPGTLVGTLATPQTVNVTSETGDLVLSFAGVGSSFTGTSNTYLSGSPVNVDNNNWHNNAAASQATATGTSTTVGYMFYETDGFSLVGFAIKPIATSSMPAYGYSTPDAGELATSWTTWHLGSGAVVVGDADYGDLSIPSGVVCSSPVIDAGDATTKEFTVTCPKYGTNAGSVTREYRGSDTSFAWDAGTPSWNTYSAPVSQAWRYFQIRLTGA